MSLPENIPNLKKHTKLRYGRNPLENAATFKWPGYDYPLTILNGNPSYTNVLEALGDINCVIELRNSFGVPVAEVSKHDSPTGISIYTPLDSILEQTFECQDIDLSPQAVALTRAINIDPKSAYGGVVALSEKVDFSTANILKKLVVDAIIAPDFYDDALELLKTKKRGEFRIFKYDANANLFPYEIRSRMSVPILYERKHITPRPRLIEDIINNPKSEEDRFIPTKNKDVSKELIRDTIIALIASYDAQSNSVVMACDGQTTGVGAGGQSRVDVVEISGKKTNNFYLRQHPKVLDLEFKTNVTKQNKILTKIAYADGYLFSIQKYLLKNLEKEPKPLTQEEKQEFLEEKRVNIAMGSDAFFPFRDGIDIANLYGVKIFAHAGTSIRKDEITEAADEYNMIEIRLGKNARYFNH